MANRPQYVRGGEFVCNRELDFSARPGGRVFAVGEVLPWRDLGMHEWQVCEFWKANMVDAAPVAAIMMPLVVAAPPRPFKHHQQRR